VGPELLVHFHVRSRHRRGHDDNGHVALSFLHFAEGREARFGGKLYRNQDDYRAQPLEMRQQIRIVLRHRKLDAISQQKYCEPISENFVVVEDEEDEGVAVGHREFRSRTRLAGARSRARDEAQKNCLWV